MARNLKALAVAFAVLSMLGASLTSVASAEYTFESEAEKTGLLGAQVGMHKAEIQGQSVTCKEVEFQGTTNAKKVASVTITPTYKNCSWNEKEAEIRMNGCDFLLDGKTVGGFGRFHLICPGEEAVEVEVTLFEEPCTATIKSQTAIEGMKYTNATPVGQKKFVYAHASLGLQTAEAHGGMLCEFFLGFEGLSYTGTSLIVGEDEATKQVTGITVAGAPDH